MKAPVTIRVKTKPGATLHWSYTGWTPNESDAKDWGTKAAAERVLKSGQPFRGLAKEGYILEVVS